jgi:alkaline phosphatase D
MSNEITRRELLKIAGAAGAALAFGTSCTSTSDNSWTERRDLYPQGVASGDPASDSVILWTRRAPEGDSVAHRLEVEVARDREFRHLVATGVAPISADTDWTCRFLAAGLEPRREYWYRFRDESGFGSRIGRTITAPSLDDSAPVSFTFVSCQDVTQGACNAYRRMIFDDERKSSGEQLAFVLHLGDFIYEVVWYPEDRPQGMYDRRLRDVVRYASGEKLRDFHVPTTLEDYRTAYRGYLKDPDLQDARARWPFVCVWDNHEFSWQGFQSQQVFNGKVRPAQTRKVAANQAWFEYQPARVQQPGHDTLDRFHAPSVADTPIESVDALGLGTEPNNVAAVRSLRVYRALRFGRNVELIITDNRSYMAEPVNADAISPSEFPWASAEDAQQILDWGRAYANGHAPETIRYGGKQIANTRRNSPPQSHLGIDQKAWFLERLRTSPAAWKIWGHSFGTLEWRTDMQNLPGKLGVSWPGAGFASFNGGYYAERNEILDTVRDHGITGVAIVAGDKHSFWAGRMSKSLPPEKFEPLAVEFITGSISAPGLYEVAQYRIPKDHPLRALYVQDRPDGTTAPAINMTMLHGVRASLALKETNDAAAAVKLSNPDVAPHLQFVDLGGHGYGLARVSTGELQTEFVCIPRPLERNESPGGGPVTYRVVHKVKAWKPGEQPILEQTILEGVPPLATKV